MKKLNGSQNGNHDAIISVCSLNPRLVWIEKRIAAQIRTNWGPVSQIESEWSTDLFHWRMVKPNRQ